MADEKTANPPTFNLTAFNYCVLFIDLLGQRAAFRDQGWLPPHETEEQKKAFRAKLDQTIRRVLTAHYAAKVILEAVHNIDPQGLTRQELNPEERPIWDEMTKNRIRKQHWSDGIASYVNLGDSEIKCHMHGIFGLFGVAGVECFMGLVHGQPLRGAMDGGWGVEITPGELYGPAVAHAYELESEVARYPRIVVGERVAELIRVHIENTERSVFAAYNRALATRCANMLIRDSDGVLIVHYLGDTFREAFTKGKHEDMYRSALKFAKDELARFQATNDAKLAPRYANLVAYLTRFAPA